MDLFDLDTRKTSSEPLKLDLGHGHWIEHLGVDCPQFRKAKAGMYEQIETGKLKTDEVSAYLIASLITNWSSEKECTFENCFDFFKRNPSLCDSVDRSASDRANFTKLLRGSSSSTRKRGKSSKNQSAKGKPQG